MLAVVLVGLVVGLGIVGLTWASLQTCSAVQGTSSCGKAGYPMLVVILVVAVALGGLLLRLARVPEPGSTSFLAVGLAAVVALLFFVNSLTDPAMIAVIPRGLRRDLRARALGDPDLHRAGHPLTVSERRPAARRSGRC